MTLYEFNALKELQRYDVVFTEGTFLDVVIESDMRFALYAIDLFFVEVTYNNLTNKIVGCKSFKTGYLLDKFSNL